MLTSAVIFLSFSLRLSLLSYLRCRRLPHRSPQQQLYQPQLYRFGEPHKTEALTRLQVGRWKAQYAQSLSVLRHAKVSKEGMITKSSIMLGLGEFDDELKEAMADLRAIDVDILTLGQYLQPTPLHLTVKEYVTPEKFAFWKEYEESIGFRYVASGTTSPILI